MTNVTKIWPPTIPPGSPPVQRTTTIWNFKPTSSKVAKLKFVLTLTKYFLKSELVFVTIH